MMDIYERAKLTHLSLFSGIGGLDLAAEMAGFRTVGQCEWADYPTKVLEKHWPDVPRWRDIRTLTGESFHEKTGLRTVDIISGGFPCQPFSVAGKRRGKEDDRYLWPEMLRVIQELRPAWVVGENVAGIVNMALDDVLSDLEALGYTAQAIIVPACAVGASHRRDRCAIVSNRDGGGLSPQGSKQKTARIAGVCQDVADANSERLQGWNDHTTEQREKYEEGYAWAESGENASDAKRELRDGSEQCTEKTGRGGSPNGMRRDAESGLGGVVDGIPAWMDRGMSAPGYWMPEPDGVPRITQKREHRSDRLKCLGNAVVPQQFYPVFQAIADIDARRRERTHEQTGNH